MRDFAVKAAAIASEKKHDPYTTLPACPPIEK